jgi:hypothetical protein
MCCYTICRSIEVMAHVLLTGHVFSPMCVLQVTVVSLISGSVFYQLDVTLTGARSYFGLCFLMVLFINFGGLPQLPLTIEAKK